MNPVPAIVKLLKEALRELRIEGLEQVLEEHPSVALGLLLSASAPVSLSALDSANRSLFSACADRASSELVTNKRGRHKQHGLCRGVENLSRYSELDAENARIGGEIRVARQEIASLS